MKAIETRYKGYRFRSRLEARWAIFFDALELRWEYEPEGFILPSGTHYLPDFRVITPQGKPIWYEVKHSGVDSDEKFDEFRQDKCRAQLLNGDPGDVIGRQVSNQDSFTNGEIAICPRCGLIAAPGYGAYLDKNGYDFGCQPCDFETPCGSDNPREAGIFPWVQVAPHKGNLLLDREPTTTFLMRIGFAIEDARSARFEHGETPRFGAFA